MLSEMRLVRVMPVEHHPTLREGLLALLNSQPDIEVVSAPANAREALADFRRLAPDVIVVDASLAGVEELVSQIRAAQTNVRIITVVDYDWDGERPEFLEANSSRFLPKEQIGRRLMPLIRGSERP
jgi:DNA-binding NarL/FixJ family response regulator